MVIKEVEFFREFLGDDRSSAKIQEAVKEAVWPSKGLCYWTVNIVYYALMRGPESVSWGQIERAIEALNIECSEEEP